MRKFALGLCVAVVLPVAAWASPTFVQEHYRWRNDNGSESAASWKANADTAITGVTRGANIRLRFAVANTSTSYSGSLAAKLEYATATGGPWTPVSTVSDGIYAFEMSATSGYADGAATTALLAGSGTFVAGKCVEAPSGTSASVTVGVSQYSNFEYCLKATAKARGNTTYYFRLTNNGGVLTTYSKYAQLTMAAGEANEPPAIVSPLTAQASVVAALSYTIQATGSEPITYGASGLPAGLSLSANVISGTPTATGNFNVGLTATNAWGNDAKTLALTVFAIQPPVASNQTASVVEAGEALIYLSWSDPDTPLKTDHTFTILSPPSSGTLQGYNERNNTTAYPDYWYYRAATGTGTRSFTWKCRDKDNDSNVATCTINVTANTAPTANNSAISAPSYTRTAATLSVTDIDAGQMRTYTLVSGPSHGVVELPPPTTGNGTAYYTAAKDYVGGDSFTWRVNDGIADSNVGTVTVTVNASAPAPWSQTRVTRKDTAVTFQAAFSGGGGYSYSIEIYRPQDYDMHGTLAINGTTFTFTPTAGSVAPGYFQWRIKYWNATTPATYSGVVTCSIAVKDQASGTDWPMWRADEHRTAATLMTLPADLHLQWRRDYPPSSELYSSHDDRYNFGYNSPAMGAYFPVVMGHTMFVCLGQYDCTVALDTQTGEELWRFYANGPMRMSPVAVASSGGVLVYAASDDGYVYCLNGADGALVRKHAACPSQRKVLRAGRLVSVWPVGGGPVLAAGKVCFASGYWPTEGIFAWALNAQTGATIWRNDGISGMAFDASWGGSVPGGPQPIFSLILNRARTKLMYGSPWQPEGILDLATGSAAGWASGNNPGGSDVSRNNWGHPYVDMDGNWSEQTPGPAVVTPTRTLTASDAAALGVAGTVKDLLAADDRLIAVTSQGSIYCFGGSTVANPPSHAYSTAPLPNVQDGWKTDMAHILSVTGAAEGGCALVLGTGTGRAVEEALKQGGTYLHVAAVEPDHARAQAVRAMAYGAGYAGTSAETIEGAPLDCGLPPYIGRLVISEDLNALGFPGTGSTEEGKAFVTRLFEILRPYGGTAWLPTTTGQDTALAGWVSAAGLANAELTRDGNFSVLKRVGALPAADQLARSPMGLQWYGGGLSYYSLISPLISGGVLTGGYDIYTGLKLNLTLGSGGLARPPADMGMTTRTVTGLPEPRTYLGTGSCNYSGISGDVAGGMGGSFRWYDRRIDGGTRTWACRVNCSAWMGVKYAQLWGIGNGVMFGSLNHNTALVHRPEVENWAMGGAMDRTYRAAEWKPVWRVGLNLGAPALQLDTEETLWLHTPNGSSVGAPNYSPRVAVAFRETPVKNYHHSAWMAEADGRQWVYASNVKGVTGIRVGLCYAAESLATGTALAIDGNLSDGCWAGGAGPMLTTQRDYTEQTRNLRYDRAGGTDPRVTFRHDGENLYVGLMDPPVSSGSWRLYLSDREKQSGGAQCFQVTTTGARLVNGVAPTAGTWQDAWTAGANTNGRFAVEMAIPWSTIASAGLWKEQLVFNVVDAGNLALRLDGGTKFSPLHLGGLRGLSAPRPATVRLYFAETEGAAVGQRVFDVKLQGQTMLSNFDIVSAAGGAWKGVMREFPGVTVGNVLDVDLVPKTGQTLLSGIEVLTDEPPADQAPVAAIEASAVSGPAPLTVSFNGRSSYDPDGQIDLCSWIFGDGDTASGSRVTKTFAAEGVYTVRLNVRDDQGVTGSKTMTVTVSGGVSSDFICSIRAAGGDYTKLSSWESAIQSDLTATNSLVFNVSARGTYAAGDDGQAVTFAGGGTGVLKHVNTGNKAYIVACSNAAAGVVTVASGHTFTVADGGAQIGRAIAEGYNDWPAGLVDQVAVSGWGVNSAHYVIIRAAAGQGHSGKAQNAGIYTGFALKVTGTSITVMDASSTSYTRIENVIIGLTASSWTTGLGLGSYCRASSVIVHGPFNRGIIVKPYCVLQNCLVYGGSTAFLLGNNWESYVMRLYNCTAADCSEAGYWANMANTGSYLVNCLAVGCSPGFTDGGSGASATTMNCASSDSTANRWGGANNRINQTFTFVNRSARDYHLAAGDTGAKDYGTDGDPYTPGLMDIDGEPRTAPWDIGADEAPDTGDFDSDGIPDASDPDDDNDGMPDVWETANGLNSKNAADAGQDADGDGLSNVEEYIAGTDPRDADSRFTVQGSRWEGSAFWLRFLTETGRLYGVAGRGDMLGTSQWVIVTNGLPGTGGYVEVRDPSTGAKKFYRIMVRME